jgi:hypothetical protein
MEGREVKLGIRTFRSLFFGGGIKILKSKKYIRN